MFLELLLMATTLPDASDYRSCLKSNTDFLEVSAEKPEDVAKAALAACAKSEPDMGHDALDAMREIVARALAGRVVQIRACRKHQGCDANKLTIFK